MVSSLESTIGTERKLVTEIPGPAAVVKNKRNAKKASRKKPAAG